MASIKALQKAAKARAAKVIELTDEQFIERYIKECSANTQKFALEVSDRLAGVWALIVDRNTLPKLTRYMKHHRVTENTLRAMGCLHTDAGKHSLKWVNPLTMVEAQSLAILFDGEFVQVSKETHANMKRESVDKNMANVGFRFEELVANTLGGTVIGQNDRKDHTFHSDILLKDGTQIECKAKSGFFALRYDGGAIRYKLV